MEPIRPRHPNCRCTLITFPEAIVERLAKSPEVVKRLKAQAESALGRYLEEQERKIIEEVLGHVNFSNKEAEAPLIPPRQETWRDRPPLL